METNHWMIFERFCRSELGKALVAGVQRNEVQAANLTNELLMSESPRKMACAIGLAYLYAVATVGSDDTEKMQKFSAEWREFSGELKSMTTAMENE